MQVRLCRMAAERWGKTIGEAAKLFGDYGVNGYIRDAYPLLHLQGDEACIDDIEEYLANKQQST